jgi:exonuclease SbcD
MRFLHTSDWHLGQNLLAKSRQAEHREFLDWLLGVLDNEVVDVLLVAGDIFDTATPANYALESYYTFLRRVAETHCRHVVVIGGNHDSPATLHAPRQLLEAFRVHVAGALDGSVEDTVLTLCGEDGAPLAVVCAVPFLRDRDIRRPEAGESYEVKQKALLEGIRTTYDTALAAAVVPLLATGHLYAAGSARTEGERDTTVGTLGEVPADCFPDAFDYVALGHLHQAQVVGGRDAVRYSGSPIALSFSEAGRQKSVVIGEWEHGGLTLRSLDVPCFQELRCLRGDLDALRTQFAALPPVSDDGRVIWAEVQLESDTIIPDVQSTVDDLAAGRAVEVLAIRYVRHPRSVGIRGDEPTQTLDDLAPAEVFDKCLDAAAVPPEDQPELRRAFADVLATVYRGEEDTP